MGQTLEDYLEPKGCTDEECFIYLLKNSKVTPNIGLNALGGRALFKASLES